MNIHLIKHGVFFRSQHAMAASLGYKGGYGIEAIPASHALLIVANDRIMLKGGPGVGKSTLTQFLALYHASRVVDAQLTERLTRRLKLPRTIPATKLDSHVTLRLPLRIELRRYAQWLAADSVMPRNTFLAAYISELINRAASSELTMDDVFTVASTNPILLILDGLDEVPNPTTRSIIFEELRIFVDRCQGEASDIQLVLSTRPQGYRGDFDSFDPIEWEVQDLDRHDFDTYANQWLECRIPSKDEREDAAVRIATAMESPSVRELAKSLLQATVMLTIARRKHAIPDARQKLFSKYVDVIFERERNKQTVRNRERELRRLHELVGYHSLCKIEAEGAERIINRDEFRGYVRQVIEDYSSADIGDRTLADIVEEIAVLSKDRLCLLSGKGVEQEDIDFVIQPFREFFAAAYLAHHEEADPDRVYSALVRRNHVWGNVLQFYAAFQTKAQQKTWIAESDGAHVPCDSVGALVELIRLRRCLVRILPEFERPRNEYIERAIANVMHRSTRWAWADREGLFDALHAFATDSLTQLLWRQLIPVSTDDPAAMKAELDMLAKAGPPRGAKDDEITAILNAQASRGGIYRCIALDVAAANDLAFDTTACSSRDLANVFRWPRSNEPVRFTKCIPPEQLVDLFFSTSYAHYLGGRPETHEGGWLRNVWTWLNETSIQVDFADFSAELSPAFELDKGRLDDGTMHALSKCNGGSAAYLRSVISAYFSGDQAAAFRDAENAFHAIGGARRMLREPTYYLGPCPSQYPVEEQWIRARQDFRAAVENGLWRWISTVNEGDGSWATLFFHPDAWPECGGIVEREVLDHLMTVHARAVKALSPTRVMDVSISQGDVGPVPRVADFIRAVIRAVANWGHEKVASSFDIVDNCCGHDAPLPDEVANELLSAADQCKALKDVWCGGILQLCARSKGVSIGLMLRVWDRAFTPLGALAGNKGQPAREVLARLLEEGTPEADSLAAFVTKGWAQRHVTISDEVVERISTALVRQLRHSEGDRMAALCTLLFDQRPSVAELDLWQDSSIVDRVIHKRRANRIAQISERIRHVAGAQLKNRTELFRPGLEAIVRDRAAFPYELQGAAADALLRLDEISVSTLSDADWMQAD